MRRENFRGFFKRRPSLRPVRERCTLRDVDVRRHVFQVKNPRPLAAVGQVDADIVDVVDHRLDFIRPFDQDHGLRVAEVVEAEPLEFGERLDPIGVDVIDVESAAILVDDDEGRACDVFAVLGPRSRRRFL